MYDKLLSSSLFPLHYGKAHPGKAHARERKIHFSDIQPQGILNDTQLNFRLNRSIVLPLGCFVS